MLQSKLALLRLGIRRCLLRCSQSEAPTLLRNTVSCFSRFYDPSIDFSAEQYRRVFSELHHFTKKSAEREKDLLAVTRDLRTEVREAQIGLEKSTIRKEELQALQDHSDAERRKVRRPE